MNVIDQERTYKAIPINDNIEKLIVDAAKYATEHGSQAPSVIRIVEGLIPAMSLQGLNELRDVIAPFQNKIDWHKLLDRVETQLQRIYDDEDEED